MNIEEQRIRQLAIDYLVADGVDRQYLESMTPEQFQRSAAAHALTHADQVRRVLGKRAEETLRGARDLLGIPEEEPLRIVNLPDGRNALIRPDCSYTDDEIRALDQRGDGNVDA